MPGLREGGVTGNQVIGGKQYRMYSPEWYKAMDDDQVHNAQVKGQAAGTGAGTAINTLQGLVPGFGGGGSSSSSSSGSAGSGGTGGPRVPFPGMTTVDPGTGGGFPYMPPSPGGGGRLSPVDTSAADAATFARAKDKVGDITRSSLTGLRSALGSRGQLGGGGETRGTGRLMEKGAGQLGDVARDQAIENVTNERSRALAQFQGDISMRGQDFSAKQAADSLAARLKEVQYQGEITQRGQDLAAANNAQSFAMQQSQSQQNILDRILQALSPGLY